MLSSKNTLKLKYSCFIIYSRHSKLVLLFKANRQDYIMLKKTVTSLLWLISLPLYIYTLFTYLLAYTLVIDHWFVGFMMMSLPVVMLLCAITAITWLFIRPSRMILPIIVLLIGYPFIRRTFGFHIAKEADKSLSVLDYNVYGFQHSAYYEHFEDNEIKEKVKNEISYCVDTQADIKCFQEFSSFREDAAFNTFDAMIVDNPYYVINSIYGTGRVFSLAIFSKYPIIHEEKSLFGQTPGKDNGNGYLLADIALKNDTIRVINLQLQSMGIRVKKVVDEVKGSSFGQARDETRAILWSLKMGFIKHSKEIELIERRIDESPYPVIVCGDFNETPYGNAYGHIRDRLKNSFEEAGNGFGFTLNRSPRFVRIDNQFCSESIEVLDFQTHNHIKSSDHYPVFGTYKIH